MVQGTMTGGSADTFEVFNTETERLVGQATVSTSDCFSGSNGNWDIKYIALLRALNNVIGELGGNVNTTTFNHVYLSNPYSIKMNGTSNTYHKAVNSNNTTLFEYTAKGTSSWGNSSVTVDLSTTTTSYWDGNITDTWGNVIGGIEDPYCQNQTIATVTQQYKANIRSYTNSAYTTSSTAFRGINTIIITAFFDI